MYSEPFEHSEVPAESSQNNGGFSVSNGEAYVGEEDLEVMEGIGSDWNTGSGKSNNSSDFYASDDEGEESVAKLAARTSVTTSTDQLEGSLQTAQLRTAHGKTKISQNRTTHGKTSPSIVRRDNSEATTTRTSNPLLMTQYVDTELSSGFDVEDNSEDSSTEAPQPENQISHSIIQGMQIATRNGSRGDGQTHLHHVPSTLGRMMLGGTSEDKAIASQAIKERAQAETREQKLYLSALQAMASAKEVRATTSAATHEVQARMLNEARLAISAENDAIMARYIQERDRAIQRGKELFRTRHALIIQRAEEDISLTETKFQDAKKVLAGLAASQNVIQKSKDELAEAVNIAAREWRAAVQQEGQKPPVVTSQSIQLALCALPGTHISRVPFVTKSMQHAYQQTEDRKAQVNKSMQEVQTFIAECQVKIQRWHQEIHAAQNTVFNELDVELPPQPKVVVDVEKAARARVAALIREREASEQMEAMLSNPASNTASSQDIRDFNRMIYSPEEMAWGGNGEDEEVSELDISEAIEDIASGFDIQQPSQTIPYSNSQPREQRAKAKGSSSNGNGKYGEPLSMTQLDSTIKYQQTQQDTWQVQVPRQSQIRSSIPDYEIRLDRAEYEAYQRNQEELEARITDVEANEKRLAAAEERFQRMITTSRDSLEESTQRKRESLLRWETRLAGREAQVEKREQNAEKREHVLRKSEREIAVRTEEVNRMSIVRAEEANSSKQGGAEDEEASNPFQVIYAGTPLWEQLELGRQYWEDHDPTLEEDDTHPASGEGTESPQISWHTWSQLQTREAGIKSAGLGYLLDDDVSIRTMGKRRQEFTTRHTEFGRLHMANGNLIRKPLAAKEGTKPRTQIMLNVLQALVTTTTRMRNTSGILDPANDNTLLEEVLALVNAVTELKARADQQAQMQASLTILRRNNPAEVRDMLLWNQLDVLLNSGDTIDSIIEGGPDRPVVRFGELTARLTASLLEVEAAEARVTHAQHICRVICEYILNQQWTTQITDLISNTPQKKRKQVGHEPTLKGHRPDDDDKGDDDDQTDMGDKEGWITLSSQNQSKRSKPTTTAASTTKSSSQASVSKSQPSGRHSSTLADIEPHKGHYVVKVGRTPGIYSTWEECQKQVHKYSGAVHAKFSTRTEAENYYYGITPQQVTPSAPKVSMTDANAQKASQLGDDAYSVSSQSSQGQDRCATPTQLSRPLQPSSGSPERLSKSGWDDSIDEVRSDLDDCTIEPYFDPTKFASKTYHAMIAILASDRYTTMRAQITRDINNKFTTWWTQYERGMTAETARIAKRINQLTIPWANATSKMVAGTLEKSPPYPGTTDKVDMLHLAKLIIHHMDSRNIPPKHAYSILQLAQNLPEGAAKIVTREIQQEEKGGIWDIAKDTNANDIVFWVVEIKKLLVRYVELIGTAVNNIVGMNTLATWTMTGATTLNEIMTQITDMIDMQLQVDSEVKTDNLLCQILRAMDTGTPQTRAFAAQIRRADEIRTQINRAHGISSSTTGTKVITDMVNEIKNKYLTKHYILPEVEPEPTKKGVRQSNQVQTTTTAPTATTSNTTGVTDKCPTCQLAAHRLFNEYGCMYYDIGKQDWKITNIAKGIKFRRRDMFAELEKSPIYQKLSVAAKADLKRRVEEVIPIVQDIRRRPPGSGSQSAPTGIAQVVAGTSGSISVVNYVTGQAEDNLIILQALSVSGLQVHTGKPIMAQYDPGSVVTIGEKAWLEQLGARFEARPPDLVVGFNGVIKGAGTRWITHDAVITLKFDMEEVARYNEVTGDPISSGTKVPVWVVLKCGVVDGLGLPLLLGGDAIKAMGLRTYDSLPVATIDRKYMMATLSLEQAHTEARATGDKFWGAAIEEETRQVHRATLVAGSNRMTIPPHEARLISLNGCDELRPTDISMVEISCKSEARLQRDDLCVEGGIHEGVPQIIVVNKGVEPITLYRGAIKAKVIPKKMRTQYLPATQTPEAVAELKKGIVAHQVRIQNREIVSPIAAIPESLWHLMAPEAKEKVVNNYSNFDTTRQLEMVTELLTKADIFESEAVVDVEWLAMVDEEMGQSSWKVFDPGTDVPAEVRVNYMQAVEDLHQRIKAGRYKTQRNVLLAQLISVPNVIYHPDPDNPRLAKGEICRIQLTDKIPITSRPRRYTWVQKAFMTAKTTIMLKQGKLEIGEGDYTSALVLVPYEERIKASLEKWGDMAEEYAKDPKNFAEVATWYRMTSDFRDLNAKTIAEAFPLPRIDDLLDCVKLGTKVYTSGDIADAFFCIELEEESRKYTGFRTHNQQFQYKVMPQGGKNCASRFSRIVAKVFKSIDEKDALKYMDDVLVHSQDFGRHLETLWRVYQCLIEHELTFKLSKLHLGYEKIKFLGHILTKEGRMPDSESAEAIDKLAYPKESQEAVRQFLGMTVYYKDYIPGYSDLAMPLYNLTRSKVDVKAEWAKDPKVYEASVDALKMALISQPCLRPPDSTRKFRVVVDACRRGRGLGAVIQQEYEDGWHPVAYWSKSLSKTEKEYSPTELECKAMHDVILKFDVYLRHKEFEVITDHNALVYMVKAQTQQNNGRLMRYLMDLQPYDFTVTYRKGEAHMDADGVSRLLRQGEVPEYLTADDVETDKGPVSEDEIEAAKELAAKKLKYISYIIEAKQKRALEKNDAMLKQVIVNQTTITKHPQEADLSDYTFTIDNSQVKQLLSLCCTATTRVLRPRSQQKPNYTGQNKTPRPRSSAKNSAGGSQKTVKFSDINEIVELDEEDEEEEANEIAEELKKNAAKEKIKKQKSITTSHEEKIAELQEKIAERRMDQRAYRGGDKSKSVMNMEKYAFDNVLQSPILAEELQYLVGKHYIDDENGREYEITGIVYDKQYRRVIGFRKDTSGLMPTPYDQNTAYEVFGEMGLLQLADLYNVDNYENEIRWPGNDYEKIRQYQLEDPEVKDLIDQVKLATDKGEEYRYMDEVYKMTGTPEILVKEGNVAEERWVWQVIIPEKMKKACMEIIHDGMGHPGASRCIATTRLKYSWKNMRKDITDHVANCRQCQLRKAYTCKPVVPVMQYPECPAPMERVHMDLTGPLPTSDHGNKYILVVKDYKTKFVWAYAIRDKLATTIHSVVTEELIPTFGPMKQLVTDRGSEFNNSLLKETCRLLKVERVSTTPSNPRANGCVEKHNSTLKDMLSMYVKENQKDWDKYLKTVTMLYNSTVNSATGYTPYYMMFGREMNMTDDVLVRPPGNKKENTGYEEHTERLVEALTFAWEVTTLREFQNYKNKNQQLERRKRIIEYFSELDGNDSEEYRQRVNDLRNSYRTYEFRELKVGDWFYRKRHPTRAFKNEGEKERFKVTMKLQPRYDGPYQITGKINAVLYTAVIDGKEIRVHAVNMKPSSNNIKRTMEFIPRKNGGKKRKMKKTDVGRGEPSDLKSDKTRNSLTGGTTGKETLNPNNKLDTMGNTAQQMDESSKMSQGVPGERVDKDSDESDVMMVHNPEG